MRKSENIRVTSRFRLWVIMPAFLFLLSLGILVIILVTSIQPEPTDFPVAVLAIAVVLLALVGYWAFFVELRKRAVKVTLHSDEVHVAPFLGLGKNRTYKLSTFDGYETTILPSEYDQFEYLFLMEENSRIITISEFYHANFKELKGVLAKRVKFLGEKEFSMTKELKEIFR